MSMPAGSRIHIAANWRKCCHPERWPHTADFAFWCLMRAVPAPTLALAILRAGGLLKILQLRDEGYITYRRLEEARFLVEDWVEAVMIRCKGVLQVACKPG